MMAEGDYMMIHSRYSNPDGSAIVVVDIMRIKDGVFVEHWDVIQPPKQPRRNRRASFPCLETASRSRNVLWQKNGSQPGLAVQE